MMMMNITIYGYASLGPVWFVFQFGNCAVIFVYERHSFVKFQLEVYQDMLHDVQQKFRTLESQY